ncbi:septal ring lytic transglycosylase RlpA family protein [Ensifer soli]|uniref:septal ring lytic transglycosylase RlpA family protein n=1 Tax=Ciceribacter sp. sgz301302 TaxID=3342379 RepID=UPI0035B7D8D2
MVSSRGRVMVANGLRLVAIPAMCMTLAACGSAKQAVEAPPKKRSKEYFAESIYGVKASPRVADGKNIPKGGGRFQVGKPYVVKGKTYTPKEEPGYDRVGMSSWYGSAFHGRLTANGEVYDKYHLSAAHPTFPLPSYARVTNLENGASVVVRVNDRGPYEYGRVIDVSSKTADLLDMKRKGTAKVRVQYVGRAPLDGHDMPYLMASYVKKGDRTPSVIPEGQIATGVMVASNEPLRKQVARMAPREDVLTIPPKSMLESGVPVTALVDEVPTPAVRATEAMAAGAVMTISLPEIGPVPAPRPQFVPVPGGAAYASAYVELDARVATGGDAFDAVLVSADPLTSAGVAAFGLRQLSKRDGAR